MQAKIKVNPDFCVGDVDPRLFGGFAEHLGRCIYGGLYEPGHARADGDGFREDVLELVRELRLPIMRYPGGNFVSGYDWEDGVGPKEQRPRRLDPAWKSTETNQFGTNEFVDWCRKADCAPLLAVNLGTRGPEVARDLVEYCNHSGGSKYSDLRREHGWEAPHEVKCWCLGNEMDGPWQMGAKTAAEYGRIACEAAKLMKMVDPTIELVACGSSSRGMATFAEWEATVLGHTFDQVDYVSLHTYLGNAEGDTARFLAKPDEMDAYIEETVACCDYVAACRRSRKRIMLSFDEWNVWYHCRGDNDRRKRSIPDWAVAPPLLEDVYNMEDALAVGGMLCSLMNHADRVKIACMAQVVNVIGPIMTETGGPAWRQTIFWPLLHASVHGRGRVLRQLVESPTYDGNGCSRVPVLKSTCIHHADTGGLTVFALNRSLDQELELSIEVQGLASLAPAFAQVLRHDDLLAVNDRDNPDRVKPEAFDNVRVTGDRIVAKLAPASWTTLTFGAVRR